MILVLHFLHQIKVLVVDDKRPLISHSQFAKLIGGSREIGTMKEGKKSGYYVARDPRVPPEIGGGIEVDKPVHDVGAIKEHFEDVKHLASKVVPTGWMKGRAATPKEKENVYQGVWTEGGKRYLDVSDRIGDRASRSSLREALERGIGQHQLAIWAAGSGRSLPTHFKTETGTKIVNPAAEMQISYLKGQEAESARRRGMSSGQRKAEKSEAIAAWEKAFPKTGRE